MAFDGGGCFNRNLFWTGSPDTVASQNDAKLETRRTGIAWNNLRNVNTSTWCTFRDHGLGLRLLAPDALRRPGPGNWTQP